MRHSAIHVVAVLCGLSMTVESLGQISNQVGSGNSRRTPRAPRFQSPTKDSPMSRSSALDSRYIGVSTRQDQIRAILAATNPRYRAQYARSQLGGPSSLVELMLNQRNLLGARSQVVRGMLQDESASAFDPAGSVLGTGSLPVGLQANSTTDAHSTGGSTSGFLDSYQEDLNRRADDYFEIGTAYFRSGDFVKAKNNFDMDREVHRESARAFVADVLCAVEKRDMNRAHNSLLLALRRAQSADDLRIDRAKFYPEKEKIDRTINVLSVVASRSTDVSAPALLLAYYSWLNDDLLGAQEYMTKALPEASDTTGNKDRNEAILRFARFINEARSTGLDTETSKGTAR